MSHAAEGIMVLVWVLMIKWWNLLPRKKKEENPYICKDCISCLKTYLGKNSIADKLPTTLKKLDGKQYQSRIILKQNEKHEENTKFQEEIDKK